MRLGGRLRAAIDILDDIDRRRRPASDALRDWGLSHRFAGSGDRAAIGNLVHDALRKRRSAVAMLGDETSRAAVFGALLLSGAETSSSLNAAFDGDRFAPDDLTENELRTIAAHDPEGVSESVRADVPDWCAPEFRSAFGDGWAVEAAALAARAPLDLRVNTIRATPENVLSALKRTGAAPCEFAPHGLRIAPVAGHGRHPNVQAEPAFRKGRFEIQDEGSQMAGILAATGTARQVLDFCAGAGGKSLALSAALNNRGQIFAHDAERRRLAPIFDRLKRGGCRNVQVLADAGELTPLEGRMDLVLADAPCTGSGVWRRRPDAKWRLTDRQFRWRLAEQSAILDASARFVRPGGRLAYVTCSVFPSENDRQIESFLRRRPDFTIANPVLLWNEMFEGRAGRIFATERGLLMTPNRTNTDGFFISIARRV